MVCIECTMFVFMILIPQEVLDCAQLVDTELSLHI
jgi:hypothetical protein